jgi:hypothetical protein
MSVMTVLTYRVVSKNDMGKVFRLKASTNVNYYYQSNSVKYVHMDV